jgi:pSer/pThr/pTyr-binding forkhead associated (FHA) protein
MAYITIQDQVFPLNKPEGGYTIGRHKSCDIQVNSVFASRQHAKIQECVDGQYLLVDITSRNGLFVNGEKAKVWVLSDRDVITIGGIRIFFHTGMPEHMQSNFNTIASLQVN